MTFALCRPLLAFVGVCSGQRARKGQRADCSLLRVRAPSETFHPCDHSVVPLSPSTPLATEGCTEADEADVRVRLSLAVGGFRDPKSGSGPLSRGSQCIASGEWALKRPTNRRSPCSFRVRCSKHAGQPHDIRAHRAIGFMLQNDGIMIRHASLCPVLRDAGVLENPMQQSRADILLGVNSDRHESLGFRIPELAVAALPRS